MRTSGFIVRKLNYSNLLAEADEIITDEELQEFEDTLAEGRIPDNLRIRDIWSHFKMYKTDSLMTTIFTYGGIALGVLGVVLVVYMGISRFCPRLVGKKVGFSPVNTGAGDRVNIKILNTGGTGDDEEHGTEMKTMNSEGTNTDEPLRERSTSMSVKSNVFTPKLSRHLINKMSREQRKAICESADMIRAVDGFKMYNTESEAESEDDEGAAGGGEKFKRVKFINATCRNCGKNVHDCLCRIGIVPDWKKNLCVNCMRSQEYCTCNKFEPFPIVHPLA